MYQRTFIFVVMLLLAPSVLPCSTCMVGDPTQTLMGVGKPFEDRLRISLELLSRDEHVGELGVSENVIDESRATMSLAWAPTRRLMLSLGVPVVKRELTTVTLAREEVDALGDATLTVKTYMQEKDSFVRDMYGLLAGVRLPTATEQKIDGEALNFDVQPGTGATTVNAGAWYARYSFPVLYYASAAYHVANEGDQQFQAGDAFVLNVSVQYAVDHTLSFPLGLEARWSEKDAFNGVVDDDTGGTLAYLAPGIIYTMRDDMLLNAAVKFPVIDRLNGFHDEGVIFTIGVTYDFNIHD